ncbi:MAG: type 4a pilus biogenesis protein PilO [Phycisphaeraceae bacterium]|nr:type 4a pilus biogenesis protein PilO [Phycisphaeraceae bacterium]
MSIKKDILTTAIAGFVITVVFCLVIWFPHHKRITAAKVQLTSVSAELDTELVKAAPLLDLNTKVQEMARSIENLDKQLVSQNELSVLLRKFSAELRRLGIENQTTQTQRPVLHADYVAIPLSLSFRGKYKQVDVFLRYMEQMNYPIFVNRLSMKRNPQGKDKLIWVDLRLMVFFAPSGGR